MKMKRFLKYFILILVVISCSKENGNSDKQNTPEFDRSTVLVNLADNIIKLSNKNFFINCSKKDLNGIIFALKNSSFLVGNNSGPINLGAALSVKSFGLIANDPVEELQYSKIKIITPDNYSNIRCRERVGMKKLTVDKVFNKIMEDLNQ